jgi:hypothetical protein
MSSLLIFSMCPFPTFPLDGLSKSCRNKSLVVYVQARPTKEHCLKRKAHHLMLCTYKKIWCMSSPDSAYQLYICVYYNLCGLLYLSCNVPST